MSWGASLEFTGVQAAIEAKINAAIGSVDGTEVAIVAGGKRGSKENAAIARAQASKSRNPFYISKETRESLRFAARGLTASAYAVRKRAVEIMGEVMLNGIRANVDKQRNEDGGKFDGLSPNYAAYKKRKFGFTVPILIATRDLIGGLKVRIEKLK